MGKHVTSLSRGDILTNIMKFLGISLLLLLAILVPAFSINPEKYPLKDNELCTSCKELVSEIHDYLESNEHDILVKLSEACDLIFSGDELSACHEYVDTFGSLLIEDAIKTLDGKLVCEKYIKLCSSDINLKLLQLNKLLSVNDNAPCILCKWAVENIRDLILKNNTPAEVEKDLVELCDKIPGLNASLILLCKGFMMTEGKEIVELLFNNTLVEDVCLEVGWCPASKALKFAPNGMVDHNSQSDIFLRKQSDNSTLCTICVDLVKQLSQTIQDNQDTIRDYVNMLCHRLPIPFDTECLDLVDGQFDSIIAMVIAFLQQPSTACTELTLCSAASHKFMPSLNKFVPNSRF